MELSLKIDLTDQQYQDLMKKSFNTISETPEMTEEIRKLIVNNISNFLKERPDLIKTYLGVSSSSYYGSYDISNKEIVKKLVESGLEEYGKEISETVKEVLKDIMKKVDFVKIFEYFFYKSMLNGFKEGMVEEIQDQNQMHSALSCDINMIKSRLGLD